MHSAQELVSHIESLASLPSVYLRIQEALDKEDCSMPEVAAIIATDPALTTRLLRVVNSALYGYGGRIDSVNRAVTILGLQNVHDLVLAMSVGNAFSNVQLQHLDMRRFWRCSVMCGLAAREIGRRIESPNPERLLILGLLADIGHLVMYQTVPDLALNAQVEADAGRPLHLCERQIVGCDHAEIGATLMEHWRLPSCFAQIVGAQIDPRMGGHCVAEATVLNLAMHVVSADRHNEDNPQAAARVDPVVWSELGLQPDVFGELRALAELDLVSYVALLFPDGL